jgi:curved DNA-binding protein CbpA
MQNLYEILEVKKDATPEEIKSSYKRLALLYHPDRNPNNPEAEEYFKIITHAYQILSDDNLRKQYDYKQKLNKIYTENPTQYSTNSSTQIFYTPPQTAQNYTPYENSYDPINYITQKGQKKILFGTIMVLFLLITTGLYFGWYMNERKAYVHLESAKKNIQSKEFKQALSNLNMSIKYKKDLVEARLLKADIYLKELENPFNAIEEYNWLIENTQFNKSNLYALKANAHWKAYQKQEALDNINMALKLDNNNVHFLYQSALIKLDYFGKESKEVCLDLDRSFRIKKLTKIDSLKKLYCK